MTKIDRVEGVAFYPLKGGHAATVNGQVPTSLPVGRTGFEVNNVRDRDLVLLSLDGTFISQRGRGNAGKKVKYPGDSKLATVRLDVQKDHLAISSSIGTHELSTAPEIGVAFAMDIFGKRLPAGEQEKAASDYFSRLLGRQVLLMRSSRQEPRVLPEKYQRPDTFNEVAAADGLPFLLVSQESLDEAHHNNSMTLGTIPIERYRGNVIANGSGLGAFGEDYIDPLQKFHIGTVGVYAVKGCIRCDVTNKDQESGEHVGGGLRVLRGRTGSIGEDTGAVYGQNLAHTDEGIISVGDLIVVEHMLQTPNVDFR